jgi:hypothetical protein
VLDEECWGDGAFVQEGAFYCGFLPIFEFVFRGNHPVVLKELVHDAQIGDQELWRHGFYFFRPGIEVVTATQHIEKILVPEKILC